MSTTPSVSIPKQRSYQARSPFGSPPFGSPGRVFSEADAVFFDANGRRMANASNIFKSRVVDSSSCDEYVPEFAASLSLPEHSPTDGGSVVATDNDKPRLVDSYPKTSSLSISSSLAESRRGNVTRSNTLPSSNASSTDLEGDIDWKSLPFSVRRKLKLSMSPHQQQPVGSWSTFRRSRDSSALSSRHASVSGVSPSSPAAQFLSRFSSNNDGQSITSDSEPEEIGGYTLGKLLGYGSFSQVREIAKVDPNTGEKIIKACKIVGKSPNSKGSSTDLMERIQIDFDHEITVWRQLHHPHLLRLISIEETQRATYCITDQITGGTLLDVIRNGPLDVEAASRYVSQLTSALKYLHMVVKVVHRDLKPENCLIDNSGKESNLVVGDFGMSDFYEESPAASISRTSSASSLSSKGSFNTLIIGPSEVSSSMVKQAEESTTEEGSQFPNSNSSLSGTENFGSLPYASPQLLTSATPIIHPSVDIWAFGVILYSMFTGKLPWHHPFMPRLRMMILQGHVDFDRFRDNAPTRYFAILQGCLQKEVKDRWTIMDVDGALEYAH